MTLHAVIAECRAVNFLDILASCSLVKTVDVLGDNAVELTCLFHLGKLIMCPVGFDTSCIKLLSVELVEHVGVIYKAVDTQEIFWTVSVEFDIVLVIKTVLTSEVRDAALSRYAGTSEKDNVIAFLYMTLDRKSVV